MQIPIGLMMVAGTILGLMTSASGYIFALYASRKMTVPVRDSLDARLEDIKMNNLKEDSQLPPLWFSLLPILIPLVFICADTFINLNAATAEQQSYLVSMLSRIIHFLGDKNLALLIAALVAMLLLIKQKQGTKYDMSAFVQTALMSGGSIILITAQAVRLAVCCSKQVSAP
jgi:GntP family gluconate:H+ symporter